SGPTPPTSSSAPSPPSMVASTSTDTEPLPAAESSPSVGSPSSAEPASPVSVDSSSSAEVVSSRSVGVDGPSVVESSPADGDDAVSVSGDPDARPPAESATASKDEPATTPAGSLPVSDGPGAELFEAPVLAGDGVRVFEGLDWSDGLRDAVVEVVQQAWGRQGDPAVWKPGPAGWLVQGEHDGRSLVVMLDGDVVVRDAWQGAFSDSVRVSVDEAVAGLDAALRAARVVDADSGLVALRLPSGSTLQVR